MLISSVLLYNLKLVRYLMKASERLSINFEIVLEECIHKSVIYTIGNF